VLHYILHCYITTHDNEFECKFNDVSYIALKVNLIFVLETDGAFSVDATSGVVRTAKPLDRESMSDYELTALAIDRGSPPMTGYTTVSVRVEDVNDSPPVFESDRIILYIPENSPVGSTVRYTFLMYR
jgi:cadherin EGF LAG seven-pass G-type receptor 1